MYDTFASNCQPFTRYTDDGVWHWQVGSLQCQVAFFLIFVSLFVDQESDAGEYTVTAVNEGGKIFHAVSVDVTGKVAVQEEITEEKQVYIN